LYAYLTGANLRHVEDDDSTFETDTDTSDGTTGRKKSNAGRRGLENNTDHKDQASHDNGPLAAQKIGNVA
jgi:hypothetical protein